jgi:hypothetical protein
MEIAVYHPPEVATRLAAAMPQYVFLEQCGSAYVSEIIPRHRLLPPNFVPWAPGVVVASQSLLDRCGCQADATAPHGWRRKRPDEFHKKANPYNLYVARCGDFWGIERENDWTLVFSFASMPVFTRTKEDAMRLAEACQTEWGNNRPQIRTVPPVRWVPSEPGGIRYV